MCDVTFCVPQYLSQMKSDLPETFSVFQDWSPKLINNVPAFARARVHAQRVKMCMQLGHWDPPQFISQMNTDFDETWYDLLEGIKDAQTFF